MTDSKELKSDNISINQAHLSQANDEVANDLIDSKAPPHKQGDEASKAADQKGSEAQQRTTEINGFEDRAEPTRFGDWESAGRCIDF